MLPCLIYRAAELTEIFCTCPPARIGISAVHGVGGGVCVGLQISRQIVLGRVHTGVRADAAVSAVLGHCPYEFSPHILIVPGSRRRMEWTFICRMSLLPKEPSGEGRKLVITVQHKGSETNTACRRQWPCLCYLLWQRHDGSHPDTEVTVLICPFHQNPKSVRRWSFPPWLCCLWKCGLGTSILALERVALLIVSS